MSPDPSPALTEAERARLWRVRLAARARAEQARALALRGNAVQFVALRAGWASLTAPRDLGPDGQAAGGVVTNPPDERNP